MKKLIILLSGVLLILMNSAAAQKDTIPATKKKTTILKPNGLPGGGGDPGGGDPGGGGGGLSCTLTGPTGVQQGSQADYTLSCTGDPGCPGPSVSVTGGSVVFTNCVTNGIVYTV